MKVTLQGHPGSGSASFWMIWWDLEEPLTSEVGFPWVSLTVIDLHHVDAEWFLQTGDAGVLTR